MPPSIPASSPRRRLFRLALALPLASLLVPLPGLRAQPKSVPAAGGYVEIKWDELVPKGWDPMKGLDSRSLGALQDTDPKVLDMMQRLREAFDNAPTEPSLEGKLVKLPGYVVPLEESKAGLTEFLLVPYFGACIHTPPPPANQIVTVLPAKPAGFRSMDTVWVSGRLRAARSDSPMGSSGYRLEAAQVEAYKAPAR
jgi:uncharacterized protein